MAEDKVTTSAPGITCKEIAPGITRTENRWVSCIRGKRHLILKAGLAKSNWFPNGEKDSGGRTLRHKRLMVGDRLITTRTRANDERVTVTVVYSPAEVARRTARSTLQETASREQGKIDRLPKSHKEFRQRMADLVKDHMDFACSYLGSNHGGYRMAPEVVQEIAFAAAEIIDEIVQGQSLFSPDARQESVDAIRAKYAREDPDLQRFLDTVSNSTK